MEERPFLQPVSLAGEGAATIAPASHSQSILSAPPNLPIHITIAGEQLPPSGQYFMPKHMTTQDGTQDKYSRALHASAGGIASGVTIPSATEKTQPLVSPASQSSYEYTRQFVAATGLILDRIKEEPLNHARALAAAATSSHSSQARLPHTEPTRNAGDSGTRANGRMVNTTPKESRPVASNPSAAHSIIHSVESVTKRKREYDREGGESVSPRRQIEKQSSPLAEITVGGVDTDTPSSISFMSEDEVPLRKPALYNPDAVKAVEAARQRLQNTSGHGSNGRPHVRCERCVRTLSPMFNRIVLCSNCNSAWHQLCHEPEINDSLIERADSWWSCAKCTAQRNRLVGPKRIKFISGGGSDNGNRKRPVGDPDLKRTINIGPLAHDVIPDSIRVSWADRSTLQKRAYFSTLSGGELIQLLVRSTELHPDLPIFPPNNKLVPVQQPDARAGPYRKRVSTSSRKPASAAANKKGGNNGKTGASSEATRGVNGHGTKSPTKGIAKPVLGTQIDPDEEDPTGLMDAWPQPGQGLYAALFPDGDDETLVDGNDYATFSHIVYDDSGRKAQENGVALSVQ